MQQQMIVRPEGMLLHFLGSWPPLTFSIPRTCHLDPPKASPSFKPAILAPRSPFIYATGQVCPFQRSDVGPCPRHAIHARANFLVYCAYCQLNCVSAFSLLFPQRFHGSEFGSNGVTGVVRRLALGPHFLFERVHPSPHPFAPDSLPRPFWTPNRWVRPSVPLPLPSPSSRSRRPSPI